MPLPVAEAVKADLAAAVSDGRGDKGVDGVILGLEEAAKYRCGPPVGAPPAMTTGGKDDSSREQHGTAGVHGARERHHREARRPVSGRRLLTMADSDGWAASLTTFGIGGRLNWHTHDSEQILYVTEGRGIVATKDKEYVVTPGMHHLHPGGREPLARGHGGVFHDPSQHPEGGHPPRGIG